MTALVLRADCAQCAALCCVSLAFDRSDLFALDKPAGVACPHLASCGSCVIHHELERRGFSGCARYDCLGAGRRVTQEVFQGRSWRDHPEIARQMFDAFRAMRVVHELLFLLERAGTLRLSAERDAKRCELMKALQPEPCWSPETLAGFERGGLPDEVRDFFASLKGSVAPRRRLSR
jgi:hypothetical protein